MKNKYKNIFLSICASTITPLFVVPISVGCSQPKPEVTMKIVGGDFILENSSAQYGVELSPELVDKEVEWQVSDGSRGSINTQGILTTFDNMGLIKITATLLSDRSVTTTKEIMILDHPRVYIEGEKTVTVGHTYDYKARVEPFESQPQEVEWRAAAEESVAEISSLDSTTGQLVVHSNGGQEGYRFAIYAREKGQNSDYDTMYVTVINPPTSFNVVLNEAASHTDGHIYPNSHLNFDIDDVQPAGADQKVEWSVDDSCSRYVKVTDRWYGIVDISNEAEVGEGKLVFIIKDSGGTNHRFPLTIESRPEPSFIKVHEAREGTYIYHLDDTDIRFKAYFSTALDDTSIDWSIDESASTGKATIKSYETMPVPQGILTPISAGTIRVVATSKVNPTVSGYCDIQLVA